MKTSLSALLLVVSVACIGSTQATLPMIQVSDNEELSSSSQNERDPARDVRKQNIYTRHAHNKDHSQVDSPKKKNVSDDQQTRTAME